MAALVAAISLSAAGCRDPLFGDRRSIAPDKKMAAAAAAIPGPRLRTAREIPTARRGFPHRRRCYYPILAQKVASRTWRRFGEGQQQRRDRKTSADGSNRGRRDRGGGIVSTTGGGGAAVDPGSTQPWARPARQQRRRRPRRRKHRTAPRAMRRIRARLGNHAAECLIDEPVLGRGRRIARSSWCQSAMRARRPRTSWKLLAKCIDDSCWTFGSRAV